MKILNYLVALSGGLDSTVALHIFKNSPGTSVRAVHIHHGLSRNADQWAKQCETLCASWQVPCIIHKVTVNRTFQEGLEAAARKARYEALANFLTADEVLITGHHQNDQAETFLLQAFRGSGPRGLSAMPRLKPFAKGWHWRPLLDQSREAIEDYARENHLTWIQDESNDTLHFDRNFIRHKILPQLTKRWPQSVRTLARNAETQAELMHYLDNAVNDLLPKIPSAVARLSVHPLYKKNTMDIFPLSLLENLEIALQHWCLRKWLRDRTQQNISKESLQRIIHEVILAASDKQPQYKIGNYWLRRYADALWLVPYPFQPPLAAFKIIPGQSYTLSNGASVSLSPTLAAFFPPETIFTVRFREGGELFHAKGETHQKPLKQLFQEWRIPPWERDKIPLIYAGSQLIAVGEVEIFR